MADNNYPHPLSQDNQPLLAGTNNYQLQTPERSLDKIKKDKAVLTFDKAMSLAGGMGLFQYLAITAFSICYVSNGYIYYGLTYLELWPEYVCSKDIIAKDCNRDLMCLNPNNPTLIYIDWSSPKSLYNWVDRLNLICEPSWKIGLIGSMYLLGWALGCLVVPKLGDLYGRRIPYAASMAASLIFYLGLILSQNIYITMALFLLIGACNPGKSNIAYVYLLELVPTKMQTYVGTALLFADGSTMILLTVYFRFISKNWIGFQIFAISFAAIAFLITLLAPESPKYLYSYKKYKEARQSLQVIAKFNRVDQFQLVKYLFDTEYMELSKSRTTIPILQSSWKNNNLDDTSAENNLTPQDQINRSTDRTSIPPSPMTPAVGHVSEEVEVKVDISIKNLIKDRKMFVNLGVLLFLWVASAFDYYLINFQLKYIKGDIYVNTVVSSVSEVVAYIVSGALYDKIGPKISFVVSFIIAIIGSILYITLSTPYPGLVPFMVLGSKFGISASFNVVYLANGLFPAVYSSTTFGLCNFFARFASMLAPILAEKQAPVPMTIFCVMAAAAAGMSLLLRTDGNGSKSKRSRSFAESVRDSVHSYSKVKMYDPQDLDEVDLK